MEYPEPTQSASNVANSRLPYQDQVMIVQRLWQLLWHDRWLNFIAGVVIPAYLIYLLIFRVPLPWRAVHFSFVLSIITGLLFAAALFRKSKWFRWAGLAFMIAVMAQLVVVNLKDG